MGTRPGVRSGIGQAGPSLSAGGGLRSTGIDLSDDPGRITYTNVSLFILLLRAFGVKEYQISGPDWLQATNFDVVAKLPAGASRDQVPLMLRALLADRFKLRLHREEKELPMYALVVAKNGPKLKESQEEGDTDFTFSLGRIRLSAKHLRLSSLADFLAGRLDRPVQDMTGLTRAYDFTLDWAPEGRGMIVPVGGEPPPVTEHQGPSIFTAVRSNSGFGWRRGRDLWSYS